MLLLYRIDVSFIRFQVRGQEQDDRRRLDGDLLLRLRALRDRSDPHRMDRFPARDASLDAVPFKILMKGNLARL